MTTADKIKKLKRMLNRMQEIEKLEEGNHLLSFDKKHCEELLTVMKSAHAADIGALLRMEFNDVVIAEYDKEVSATIIQNS